MKRIVPITDLQRQAGQIIASLGDSLEPVVVTQRGRAAAVIVSSDRYAEIEADLARLDELELIEMVAAARQEQAKGATVLHEEVKRRLSEGESGGGKSRARRAGERKRR